MKNRKHRERIGVCVYLKMQLSAQVGGVLLLLWLHSWNVSCQSPPSQVKLYDYSDGPNGTANWGNFPGWELCKNGTQQSPINIIPDVIRLDVPLDVVCKSEPVAADLYNDGLTPTLDVVDNDAGTLKISGLQYELEEIHFHTPSEHLIFGKSFTMEQHMVHKSADGKVAVIAILYKLGSTNKFLDQFFGMLPPYTTPNVKTRINIKLPLLKYNFYYRYNGSLTTPPCSENVTWTILNYFPTLSDNQLQQLQASKQGDNARPLQPKNGRTVHLFLE